MVAAWLCLPAGARADLVRAAADRDHVAVVRDNQVRRSLDGGPAETLSLPPESWVLDALPDRSGAVWIAIGPIPRDGPARLGRVVAGTETVWRDIPGSDAVGELHLVPRRGGLPLVISATGAWTVSRAGEARRVATWSVDGYGFYAASARTGPDGALTVLAPTFNTCSSADLLEGLVEVRLRGGRVTTRTWAAGQLGDRTPALAADGTIVREALVRHDGARTVAVIDDGAVVRLAGRQRRSLGRLEATEHPVDVSPDHRGGALVLMDDGRLVRFRGGPGRVLSL